MGLGHENKILIGTKSYMIKRKTVTEKYWVTVEYSNSPLNILNYTSHADTTKVNNNLMKMYISI